ncbi:uncharacterized protein A4U43_C01F14290 [Asparagus officinalis]|uniref:Uncharacterized protein n=2 Tax=Asparagus officinalis TaxID=4686 RepID=A0A5P1FPH9_ASPOF|nr:myb-related protein Zm1-like [Asparagus officinalis]ONK80138.1 uncharacterized protein A4U43_C01F14290 [Asparagus officinalis]
MGRGRAPCCAKVGLNKGSWTPEEDMRLIAYIHKYGHGNWRALPKFAGLLRCGKSCRLRWINYLRPDIKRGNFTKEEEDTIIKLHGLLGNKWSKIASCLPGRTDNEIKNVWNTHLKKRLAPKEEKSGENPEEIPSSPSSITTASVSVSCSDEGESKKEKEQNDKEQHEAMDDKIDKIELSVEPNLDMWDMLEDSSYSEITHENVEPPSSDVRVKGDDGNTLVDLPEILIEPEIWNMINDDLNIALTRDTTAAATPRTHHQNIKAKGEDEKERWLQYLEKELDSWEECAAATAQVEGADPVASYFQALQASPSPLDILY